MRYCFIHLQVRGLMYYIMYEYVKQKKENIINEKKKLFLRFEKEKWDFFSSLFYKVKCVPPTIFG